MIKNIEEAKKLVERYNSITLAEIKQAWNYRGVVAANKLTGFGNPLTCTLCIAVISKDKRTECKYCIYNFDNSDEEKMNGRCSNGENIKSYMDIWGATSPRKLLNAFRRRAKHLEKIIKEVENGNDR